ncbi:DUF6571 family protein [Streptomyces sp. RFCAC02]|uniref:DUF6571 family protein n=1 Tax=Streptomyces sp. RFCAC02 TaxID=2499143 RepID=UPI00102215AA|nr:DUF6571 family protein [Streptomyces sp. RFCAC02]
MPLTFQDAYGAPLAPLKAAADAWAATAIRLASLAADARDTLLADCERADWEGVNAGVTRPFVTRAAREFDDAAEAADGLRRLLEDAHTTLERARTDLRRAVDTDAPAAYLTVSDSGAVAPRHPLAAQPDARQHDTHYAAHQRAEQEAVAALQRRIDTLVEAFDDADQSLARALRANAADALHDFAAARHTSLDQEELARALVLVGKGRELTTRELAVLNDLLQDNRRSGFFTTGLFGALGAEGTLSFFGGLTAVTDDDRRLGELKALQRNLGHALATATDPDRATHLPASFGATLRTLGTEHIERFSGDSAPPYGYQLLGGLLRYGSYDPAFLTPIAEHVVELHADDPARFAATKGIGFGAPHPFNPNGRNGAGYDPVLSVLEALGHSPEAAQEFFTANPAADLGTDGEGRAITNYLDYFTQESYRDFADINGFDERALEESITHLPDALGHALQAAALGHPWDASTPAMNRSEAGARVMEDVVHAFGSDSAMTRRMEALTDSLGTMAAAYVDDINWALNRNRADSIFCPEPSDTSTHAIFRDDAGVFLSTLGQHPDGYATVAQAEQIYTAGMMEAQVAKNGAVDEAAVREVLRTGASVQGMLDQSRADQLTADGRARDEEYNRALETRTSWITFASGAAIGAGVALLPVTAAGAGAAAVLVPLGIDTASGALTEHIDQLIGHWSETAQRDTSDETRELTSALFAAGRSSLQQVVDDFMRRRGFDPESDFGQDLEDAFTSGYATGVVWQERTGPGGAGG